MILTWVEYGNSVHITCFLSKAEVYSRVLMGEKKITYWLRIGDRSIRYTIHPKAHLRDLIIIGNQGIVTHNVATLWGFSKVAQVEYDW
jgi:hypothetical protein